MLQLVLCRCQFALFDFHLAKHIRQQYQIFRFFNVCYSAELSSKIAKINWRKVRAWMGVFRCSKGGSRVMKISAQITCVIYLFWQLMKIAVIYPPQELSNFIYFMMTSNIYRGLIGSGGLYNSHLLISKTRRKLFAVFARRQAAFSFQLYSCLISVLWFDRWNQC